MATDPALAALPNGVTMPAARRAPIRVVYLDSHRLIRQGISLILEQDPDIHITGTAGSGEDAIQQYIRDRPDLVIMDIQLDTGMGGVDAIRVIRTIDPRARILVLTLLRGDQDVRAAIAAGAAAYLLKDVEPQDLIAAVHKVVQGKSVLPDALAAELSTKSAQPQLTPRQLSVLELIASGHRNKEIAASLGCSEGTVHNHVKQILHRLGVADRNAAVTTAIRRGIIHVT
jgi:DNA-binding NarL/FixJ family response regulator